MSVTGSEISVMSGENTDVYKRLKVCQSYTDNLGLKVRQYPVNARWVYVDALTGKYKNLYDDIIYDMKGKMNTQSIGSDEQEYFILNYLRDLFLENIFSRNSTHAYGFSNMVFAVLFYESLYLKSGDTESLFDDAGLSVNWKKWVQSQDVLTEYNKAEKFVNKLQTHLGGIRKQAQGMASTAKKTSKRKRGQDDTIYEEELKAGKDTREAFMLNLFQEVSNQQQLLAALKKISLPTNKMKLIAQDTKPVNSSYYRHQVKSIADEQNTQTGIVIGQKLLLDKSQKDGNMSEDNAKITTTAIATLITIADDATGLRKFSRIRRHLKPNIYQYSLFRRLGSDKIDQHQNILPMAFFKTGFSRHSMLYRNENSLFFINPPYKDDNAIGIDRYLGVENKIEHHTSGQVNMVVQKVFCHGGLLDTAKYTAQYKCEQSGKIDRLVQPEDFKFIHSFSYQAKALLVFDKKVNENHLRENLKLFGLFYVPGKSGKTSTTLKNTAHYRPFSRTCYRIDSSKQKQAMRVLTATTAMFLPYYTRHSGAQSNESVTLPSNDVNISIQTAVTKKRRDDVNDDDDDVGDDDNDRNDKREKIIVEGDFSSEQDFQDVLFFVKYAILSPDLKSLEDLRFPQIESISAEQTKESSESEEDSAKDLQSAEEEESEISDDEEEEVENGKHVKKRKENPASDSRRNRAFHPLVDGWFGLTPGLSKVNAESGHAYSDLFPLLTFIMERSQEDINDEFQEYLKQHKDLLYDISRQENSDLQKVDFLDLLKTLNSPDKNIDYSRFVRVLEDFFQADIYVINVPVDSSDYYATVFNNRNKKETSSLLNARTGYPYFVPPRSNGPYYRARKHATSILLTRATKNNYSYTYSYFHKENIGIDEPSRLFQMFSMQWSPINEFVYNTLYRRFMKWLLERGAFSTDKMQDGSDFKIVSQVIDIYGKTRIINLKPSDGNKMLSIVVPPMTALAVPETSDWGEWKLTQIGDFFRTCLKIEQPHGNDAVFDYLRTEYVQNARSYEPFVFPIKRDDVMDAGKTERVVDLIVPSTSSFPNETHINRQIVRIWMRLMMWIAYATRKDTGNITRYFTVSTKPTPPALEFIDACADLPSEISTDTNPISLLRTNFKLTKLIDILTGTGDASKIAFPNQESYKDWMEVLKNLRKGLHARTLKLTESRFAFKPTSVPEPTDKSIYKLDLLRDKMLWIDAKEDMNSVVFDNWENMSIWISRLSIPEISASRMKSTPLANVLQNSALPRTATTLFSTGYSPWLIEFDESSQVEAFIDESPVIFIMHAVQEKSIPEMAAKMAKAYTPEPTMEDWKDWRIDSYSMMGSHKSDGSSRKSFIFDEKMLEHPVIIKVTGMKERQGAETTDYVMIGKIGNTRMWKENQSQNDFLYEIPTEGMDI